MNAGQDMTRSMDCAPPNKGLHEIEQDVVNPQLRPRSVLVSQVQSTV